MSGLAPSNLGLQELKQPTQVQVYQFPVGVQLSDCNCTFLWKTVQFGGDKLGQKTVEVWPHNLRNHKRHLFQHFGHFPTTSGRDLKQLLTCLKNGL